MLKSLPLFFSLLSVSTVACPRAETRLSQDVPSVDAMATAKETNDVWPESHQIEPVTNGVSAGDVFAYGTR